MEDTITVVYIEDGEVTATLGTINANHSMTVAQALDILGLVDGNLDDFFNGLGWDEYDYNCIDFAE